MAIWYGRGWLTERLALHLCASQQTDGTVGHRLCSLPRMGLGESEARGGKHAVLSSSGAAGY